MLFSRGRRKSRERKSFLSASRSIIAQSCLQNDVSNVSNVSNLSTKFAHLTRTILPWFLPLPRRKCHLYPFLLRFHRSHRRRPSRRSGLRRRIRTSREDDEEELKVYEEDIFIRRQKRKATTTATLSKSRGKD